MKSALASCAVLLAAGAGPAAGQEIRPTLDKIKETGVIQLDNRASSRPFSFVGSDGQPAGFSIDLCLQVAGAIRESLKLPGLKVAWVTVTPADRIAKLVKALETLQVGHDLRVTVLRDDKIVELAMKWTGFPTQFLPPVK